MFSIPFIDGESHVDQTVNLDGVDFELSLRYVQRSEVFTLSIYTSDGEELSKGATLLVDWPLFVNVTHEPRMPAGRLVVISNSPDKTPPKIGELGPGKRCELIYITAAELTSV